MILPTGTSVAISLILVALEDQGDWMATSLALLAPLVGSEDSCLVALCELDVFLPGVVRPPSKRLVHAACHAPGNSEDDRAWRDLHALG